MEYIIPWPMIALSMFLHNAIHCTDVNVLFGTSAHYVNMPVAASLCRSEKVYFDQTLQNAHGFTTYFLFLFISVASKKVMSVASASAIKLPSDFNTIRSIRLEQFH